MVFGYGWLPGMVTRKQPRVGRERGKLPGTTDLLHRDCVRCYRVNGMNYEQTQDKGEEMPSGWAQLPFQWSLTLTLKEKVEITLPTYTDAAVAQWNSRMARSCSPIR